MKIQFIKTYEDPLMPGRFFQPGWVAEFTDPEGQRVIDAGYAKEVPAETRSWKSGPALFTDCVPAQPTPLVGPFDKVGDVDPDDPEALSLTPPAPKGKK
ncbi:MAG: hypothetical protein KDC61_05740 [Saprospiraceae bacterium]|nr:hypothetical protein [Saprospiraceae bacterium]